MTIDLIITDIGDTWVNTNRPGTDYSRNPHTRMKSGERFTYLLPELPTLAGATVLDAYLVGRGALALSAQTITVRRVTERWAPGKVRADQQPARTGSAATAIGALAADVAFELTGLASMLQAVADGSDWHGFRLETSTTTDQRFRATDSGLPAWELHISLSDVPDAPDNLRPNGGGAVSTSTPITAWETFDFGDEDDSGQAKLQVQVDTPAAGAEPDSVSPDWTSTWTVSTDPQFDLATSTATPTGNGPHYWRVRVEDADGNISPWSDWADYTVSAMPSLVMDSPVGPFGDPSPTVAAHLSSGTLSHWKARITGRDRSNVRIRSGLQTGPIAWEVPLRHKGRRVIRENPNGGVAGWLNIRAWVDGDRATAVGEPGNINVWIPLEFDDDLTVQAPTNLSVVQYADGDPRNVWSWSHNETPRAFLIQVDGVTVARLDPADLTVNAGVWTWTDSGQVSPLRPHTLSVRAIEPGGGVKRSNPASVSERAHTVKGVWLLPDESDPIKLSGTAVSGFSNPDSRARYQPLVGPPVDIIYDLDPGLRGAFGGSVDSRDDVWAALDAIDDLKRSKSRLAQMVWGSQSIRVRVLDPDSTTSDMMLPSNLIHDVRFEFVEVD